MYANDNYQRGASPYPPPGSGIIASGSGTTNDVNMQSQSQSQSPYNPYLNNPSGATYGSPQTSCIQRSTGQGEYMPNLDQRWRRMTEVPAAAAVNLASGSTGVQPVFWNQGVSVPGPSSIQDARIGQGHDGQSNGLHGGTGAVMPVDDVAMEIGHLHRTLLELISLLRSLQYRSSSALPPQESLDRISRLSSIVNTGLSSLSSRTYLDISSLDLPGPSTSVRPETAPAISASGKSKGKARAGEPSQAEKEMDIIRRRRDILIARAKESGRIGGSIAGQRERTKKEGTEEIWHSASASASASSLTQEGGDGRRRMTATPNGHYSATMGDPVQRPASTPSWMSQTRGQQQSPGFFSPPNHQYSSSFDHTPISNLGIPNIVPDANLPETTQLDQFFSTQQEIPNPATMTTTFPFLDTSLDLDLPLLKLQLAKSEALALAMHGRCHSCSVVVEGEWMEGPDGPNSLCLSCGPHYARLKQKKRGDPVDEGFKMTPEQLNVALGVIPPEQGIGT